MILACPKIMYNYYDLLYIVTGSGFAGYSIFPLRKGDAGTLRAWMRVPPRHSLRIRGSRFHCRKPKPRFPLERPLSPVAAAGVPLLPTASGRHARRVQHLTSTVVPGLAVQRHSG